MALYTLGSSGAEPLAGKEFYHLTGFGIVLFQIAHALGKAFVIGRLKKNPEYSNIFGPLLSAPPKSAGVTKYPWCSEAYRYRNHLADIGMCIGY